MLPSGRRAGCSGTKSGDFTWQGKAPRTSPGWHVPAECGSPCIHWLQIIASKYHSSWGRYISCIEHGGCSSAADQRTLGFCTVPWQWLGLTSSKKIKKRTIIMPCPSDFPFLSPHFSHVLNSSPFRRETQHHAFWQWQLFYLLKCPCVAEGLYWQLFQGNNS